MDAGEPLRVLLLEDERADAELVEHALRQSGLVFDARCVETEKAFRDALDSFRPDVILADYKLPNFDGMAALKIARQERPEVPMIMVTGVVPDIEAVEFLHAGARDYVLKDRMARLGEAVKRALSVEQGIRARKAAEITLLASLQRAQAQAQGAGKLAMADALVAGDVERFARQVTETAARVCGCERASVWLFNDDGSELRCIDLYEATQSRHSAGMVLERSQFENELRIVMEEKYVAADEPRTDPRTAGYTAGYLEPLGITSMLDALIHISGRNIGLLCFEHVNRPHHWEPDETAFAAQLAELLALSLASRERLGARKALEESEARYRQLFEVSRDALMTLAPPSWQFTGANRATLDMFGASSTAEFIALGPWQLSPELQPDGRKSDEKFREMIAGAMQEGSNFFEWEHRRLNGECFAANMLLTRMELGGASFLQATVRDIGEQKKAEAALIRLNRMYRILSLCNQALVRAADEYQIARDMCALLVAEGGFRLAWVALLDDAGSLLPLAWQGADASFGDWLGETYASTATEACPGRDALRTGDAVALASLAGDPASPLAKLKSLGATGLVALPLQDKDRNIGILCLCSGDADPIGEEELALLREMGIDLSYGIVRLRGEARSIQLEAERLRNLETLEHNLDATVAAIAATVEMRDPYTAGHQRKVARLAVAIALEMGLPKDRTEGIRIAGVVHDIGKIHVPAEILASPAKLSDAEFEIIKTHPQAGYDILKDIEFGWPVAEVVYQHHEKLDGSGYPRRLKGEEILLEARILCVADVVEAMSSHRPYRPGFGIFPALQEISRHKGVKYDAAATEACLRLFLEKGFEL